MNLAFFIANRISGRNGQPFSRLVSRIAAMATALSLSVMIVATAMVSGFQNIISKKLYGLWGHIELAAYQKNSSFENNPMNFNQNYFNQIKAIAGVKHIEVFATKPGIIKGENTIEGIVLKGIDSSYDFTFLSQNLLSGNIDNAPLINFRDTTRTPEIIISERIAKRCGIRNGDKLLIYFIDRAAKVRKFKVSGIYNTGLEEFDKIYAFTDLSEIRKVNNWKPNQIGGYEILCEKAEEINNVNNKITELLNPTDDLYNSTIQQKFPQLFDWLGLQSMNEKVILILMSLVAIINIVSTLIILILERTKMVGILKAMGMNNSNIRLMFLWNAMYIAIWGIFWGNLIGIGICLIQLYTGIIPLPEETYYMSVVPINLHLGTLVALNFALLLINILSLWVPTILVNSISPVKAIRYE